jgi:hypothetical protein
MEGEGGADVAAGVEAAAGEDLPAGDFFLFWIILPVIPPPLVAGGGGFLDMMISNTSLARYSNRFKASAPASVRVGQS